MLGGLEHVAEQWQIRGCGVKGLVSRDPVPGCVQLRLQAIGCSFGDFGAFGLQVDSSKVRSPQLRMQFSA